MRLFKLFGHAVASLCVISAATASEEGFLSSQGYTGLINVPTAGVSPTGAIDLQYNDQIDRLQPDNFVTGETLNFSVGVLSGIDFGAFHFGRMELGGRLTNAGTQGFTPDTNLFRFDGNGIRDLSGNAKLRLFEKAGWPGLAVGLQDIGGDAVNFRSRYLVADYDWRWFKLAAGAGTGRLDGVFAGLEVAPSKYVSLIAENDSVQNSFGARLSSADLLKRHRFDLMYRFSADEAHSDNFFSLSWRHELGKPWFYEDTPRRQSQPVAPKRRFDSCDAALAEALERQGFERIRTGDAAGATLVVELENRRYNKNVLDGAGVAIGLAAEHCAQEYENVVLQLLHNGTRQFWVQLNLPAARAFFETGLAAERINLSEAMTGGYGALPQPVAWRGKAGPRRTFLDIVLEPSVNYTVGTEVGVFDYSAALETYISAPLWSGAALSFRRNDNIKDTKDFEPNGIINRQLGGRINSEWRAAYLQQAFYLGGGFHNLLHLGMTRIGGDDNTSIVEELAWLSPGGLHSVYARYARYEYDDDFQRRQGFDLRYSFTGRYRIYSPKYDISADFTAGRFFFDDEGAKLNIERYFGDTAFGIFYRTDKSGDNQAGGVSIELPFGPREDMKGRVVQLRGTPDFATALQTTVNRDDGSNTLNNAITVEIFPEANLKTVYMDRGRLGLNSFREGLSRMREAWYLYAVPVYYERGE